MKRALALILSALLILAAVPALADDPEPIVGVWYLDMEPTDNSGARILWVYIITEKGDIYLNMNFFPVKGDPADPLMYRPGSWEKTDADTYVLHGWEGADPAYVMVSGDTLVMPLSSTESYYTFRRMEPMTSYDIWPPELMKQLQPK